MISQKTQLGGPHDCTTQFFREHLAGLTLLGQNTTDTLVWQHTTTFEKVLMTGSRKLNRHIATFACHSSIGFEQCKLFTTLPPRLRICGETLKNPNMLIYWQSVEKAVGQAKHTVCITNSAALKRRCETPTCSVTHPNWHELMIHQTFLANLTYAFVSTPGALVVGGGIPRMILLLFLNPSSLYDLWDSGALAKCKKHFKEVNNQLQFASCVYRPESYYYICKYKE